MLKKREYRTKKEERSTDGLVNLECYKSVELTPTNLEQVIDQYPLIGLVALSKVFAGEDGDMYTFINKIKSDEELCSIMDARLNMMHGMRANWFTPKEDVV